MKVLLCLSVLILAATARKFYNHKVYKVHVTTREQARLLAKIDADSKVKMTMFSQPHHLGDDAVIMIPPEELEEGINKLESVGLQYELVDDNLQATFDSIMEKNEEAKASHDPKLFPHTEYRNNAEILDFVNNRVANCPSGLSCTTENIGTSYEGRTMYVLKISAGSGRRIFWWDSTIHAREWIAPATGLYVIDELLNGFRNNNADVVRYFGRWDFYFLPVVNPDGYDFTWTEDRTWRKTMTPNEGSICLGTDCNRNYGFHWGEVGNSPDPCSDIYGGPDPWSEPEAQNQRDFMNRQFSEGREIEFMLTVHSHGEYILLPYGYTYDAPRNLDELDDVADAGHAAILATSGRNWRVGSSSIVLYPSSGTSRDWGHGAPPPGDDEGEIGAGVRFVYTLELRGDGLSFYPGPESIIPSGEEIWAMMNAMMNEVMRIVTP